MRIELVADNLRNVALLKVKYHGRIKNCTLTSKKDCSDVMRTVLSKFAKHFTLPKEIGLWIKKD